MSSLPSELILLTISIAATQDRPTAATLRLVSRWVRDEVEPILYRVLTLRRRATESTRSLSSPKYIAHTQCLGFEVAPRNLLMYPLLRANQKIRNLIIEVTPNHILAGLQECFPRLQELHMFGMTLPNPTVTLPHLRRLHFDIWYPSRTCSILNHPNLTHIALSIVDDASIGPGIKRIVLDLLARLHRPLILLLVRLRVNDNEFRTAYGHQPIEAFLTPIEDRRLVVTRIDAGPSVQRQRCVDEWERNVMSGESIWDVAETESNASTS